MALTRGRAAARRRRGRRRRARRRPRARDGAPRARVVAKPTPDWPPRCGRPRPATARRRGRRARARRRRGDGRAARRPARRRRRRRRALAVRSGRGVARARRTRSTRGRSGAGSTASTSSRSTWRAPRCSSCGAWGDARAVAAPARDRGDQGRRDGARAGRRGQLHALLAAADTPRRARCSSTTPSSGAPRRAPTRQVGSRPAAGRPTSRAMPADLRRHGHLLLIAALLVGTLCSSRRQPRPRGGRRGPGDAVDLAADRHAIPDAVYGMSFAPPRWRASSGSASTASAATGWPPTTGARESRARPPTTSSRRSRVLAGGGRVVRARPRSRLDREHVAGGPRRGVPSLLDRAPARQGRRRRRQVRQPLPCSSSALALPLPAGRTRTTSTAATAARPDCGYAGRRRGHPVRDRGRAGVDPGPLQRVTAPPRRATSATHGLGNEPALWSDTHRDLHPDPVGYDELWSRTKAMAAAVKDADPTARTLFFSEWARRLLLQREGRPIRGPLEGLPRPPGARRPGARRVAARPRARGGGEQRAGRTLDLLDLHWYPQGGGRRSTPPARCRTRPSDPSWIGTGPAPSRACARGSTPDYPGTSSR